MLGEQLRKLRDKSRLSGSEAASHAGMSQSKLSKIETGLLLPSADDLTRLCSVYRTPKSQTNSLLEQLRGIRTEYISWRIGHRRGFAAKQKSVGAQEQKAKHIRVFQTAVVPGLLQIPKYARCVMQLANITEQQDLDQAVASRLQRQSILYAPEKSFEFLVTEPALTSRFCNPEVVCQQLDRLQLFFDLENLTLGFLPNCRSIPSMPQNSFVMFDDEQVAVETFTAEITLFDEDDIKRYSRVFEIFKSSAIYGPEALSFLRELKQKLQTVH